MERIGKAFYKDVVGAYVDDLKPMAEIADWFHVSRQSIWKVLRKCGVDTAKKKVVVKCAYCGEDIFRTKARIRNQGRHFCNQEHYYLYLEVVGGPGKYLPNREGQRLGRAKVSMYFDLQPEHVVHHEDKDCLNNRAENLKVFANTSDHVKYHRGVDKPKPIWDGSKLASANRYFNPAPK